jgi:hypothetical protein
MWINGAYLREADMVVGILREVSFDYLPNGAFFADFERTD